MAVGSKIEDAPLSGFRRGTTFHTQHQLLGSNYPTITHKGKGTAPLLDNWKVPMCDNLCAPWQGRLTKMSNLYSHSRKHSQQDCLLKNQRGTALRISRARLSTGLLAQNSKRHCPPNLKSQTPHRITCSKIEDTALRISRARLPTRYNM
ncbi:hypothetical protein PS2_043848 [Malus domestica]